MDIPKDLKDQIARHEQYAQVDSSNLPLRMKLGDLYHKAGRLDDALDCYEACERLQPGHRPARSSIASVLISMHRFADAQTLLQALLDAGEEDAALHHNIGLAHYFQEHWENAAAHFAHAESAGLAHARNCAYLARSLHHLDDLDGAIAACRRWVAIAPGAASLSYLSLLLLDDGRLEEAHSAALRVLEQSPDDPDAHVAAGTWALEQHEPAMALEHFTSALAVDEGHGRAWMGAGLTHLYESRHAEAVSCISTAATIFPGNAGILVKLGWAKLLASDTAGARGAFMQAAALDEHDAESRSGLAAVLAVEGRHDEARDHLAQARRIAPEDITVEVAQTFLLAAQQQRDDAVQTVERLLKRSPRPGSLPLSEHLRLFLAKRSPGAKAAAHASGGRLH